MSNFTSNVTLLLFLVYLLGASCYSAENICDSSSTEASNSSSSFEKCHAHLTETIPYGVTYPNATIHPSTVDEMMKLCLRAEKTLDIASFYWTLLSADVTPDPDNTSHYGEQLFNCISEAPSRGVQVRIAVSQAQNPLEPLNPDLEKLKAAGVTIRVVNFTQLIGAGVLHTKFILADHKSFYIGSANMDWRSLSQVKEMGVIASDCPALAVDLSKIFSVYWQLGESTVIPEEWPSSLSTGVNKDTPLKVEVDGKLSSAYISSSPKSFNPSGRTNDIDAILDIISKAKKYINIAVMDYFPMYLYQRPSKFWPVIDDALKRAVIEKGVRVKLLVSKWSHSRKSLFNFLSSLDAFRSFGRGEIQVKVFTVPSTPEEEKIPFARVNHNKYMVTDSIAYIGTSNWSAGMSYISLPHIATVSSLENRSIFLITNLFIAISSLTIDYFTNTGGVAFVVSESDNACHRNNTLRKSLVNVFYRDWNSPYAHNVSQIIGRN